MMWPEFWWEVDKAFLEDEVNWMHTREIISVLVNANSRRGNKKGKDLVPLTLDGESPKAKGISLTEFLKKAEKSGDKLPDKAKKWGVKTEGGKKYEPISREELNKIFNGNNK